MAYTCIELQEQLAAVKALQQQYTVAFARAREENLGHFDEALALKAQLETALRQLERAVLVFEVLSPEALKIQYGHNYEVLEQSGILQRLRSGERGIKVSIGKYKQECPMPTFETVYRLINEQAEVLGPKIEQGFIRLIIVPIGERLGSYKLGAKYTFTGGQAIGWHGDGLFAAYARFLVQHAKTASNPNGLDVNTNQPLNMFTSYNNADTDGTLVYYPKRFNQTNHDGKTKEQLLATLRIPGWQILLIEDRAELPKQNEGAQLEQGGRQPLECFESATDTLAKLRDPNSVYAGEQGLTYESYMMANMVRLAELAKKGVPLQPLDQVTCSLMLGMYRTTDGGVPSARWIHGCRQAFFVSGGLPDSQFDDLGPPAAVEVP